MSAVLKPKSLMEHTATPFEAFYNRQTPANAVALANADHRAGSVIDWEFVAALRKAEHVCNAHDQLVKATRECLDQLEHEAKWGSNSEPLQDAINSARRALAKAEAA